MKSPFPGMDPYLEAHWSDVHASLVIYIRDQLQPQLPDDLRARVEQGLRIEPPVSGGTLRSDVHVTESSVVRETPSFVSSPYATPLLLEMPPVPRHIEIVDRMGKVITAIEVLSPANKTPGSGREAYLRKQEAFLASGTNLVEIDLLRAGDFVLSCGEDWVPPRKGTAYHVCVYRAASPELREVYVLPLREPLPSIHIPLRSREEDIGLDLRALIDKTYRQGGYDFLDYTAPPEPPLTAEDAAWARTLESANIC